MDNQSRQSQKTFYGWWIILVSALGMFMGYGAIFNFTFGVFSTQLSHEFNFSRSVISLAYALSLIAYAATRALIGRRVDWYRARKIIVSSGRLFGLGLMSFCLMTVSLSSFYGTFLMAGMVVGL